MKIKLLAIIAIVTLALGGVAEAKWWIFGQANDEVAFSYLYLNGVSYEESGPKASVPKSSLANGEIRISGRARVGKGKIGAVRISLDGRTTWQDAILGEDGTFEFRFRPELARTYLLYVQVTDTAGKANDVEKTRKELTVIESNAQQLVRGALDELVAAYRGEDAARFMKLVSVDFAGDSANLDRAVRKDFSAFDNIDIRFTLNNVTLDPAGRIFASVTFSRSVTSSKSGRTLNDKGATDLIFKLEEGGAKIFSMKNPLIFGLSDPTDVATGNSAAIGDPLIIVDASGNMAEVPAAIYLKLIADGGFRITTNADGTSTVASADGNYTTRSDGTLVSSSGGSSTVESGTNILLSTPGGQPPAGFNFVTGEADIPGAAFVITGNINFNQLYGFLQNGATVQDLGTVSLSTLAETPASGYGTPASFDPQVGHSYAFLLGNGKYAAMELKSVNISGAVFPPTISFRIDYRYQTDGTRTMR